MNKKALRQAFTFIEILVVVTIIGIITTIGLVTYTQFLKQSRDAKRKGDIEQIRGALELYRSKNDTYPTVLTFGGSLCDPLPGGCASATYLTKIANDPRTGVDTYYFTSDGITYSLGALLEQPPGSPSSCGNCVLSPGTPTACNYCMGPFGQQ